MENIYTQTADFNGLPLSLIANEVRRMIVDLDKLYEGTGGPAYPYSVKQADGCTLYHKGMTLRDWFAGQALAGLAAAYPGPGCAEWSYYSEAAFKIADAMIEARKLSK